MRFLSNQAGNVMNGTTEHRITKDIAAIQLNMTFTAAANVAFPAPLKDILAGIEVNLSFDNVRGNQDWAHTKTPLYMIIEEATNREGVVEIELDATGLKVLSVVCTIPVGNEGVLKTASQEALNFELTGLNQTNNFALTAYGIEGHIYTPQLVQWVERSVPNGTGTESFNVQNYHKLVLPVHDGTIEKIKFSASNGNSFEWYLDEIKNYAASNNDAVYVTDTGYVSGGYESVAVIDVSEIETIDVVTDESGLIFYGIKHLVVTKVTEAQAENDAISDTTEKMQLTQIEMVEAS